MSSEITGIKVLLKVLKALTLKVRNSWLLDKWAQWLMHTRYGILIQAWQQQSNSTCSLTWLMLFTSKNCNIDRPIYHDMFTQCKAARVIKH